MKKHIILLILVVLALLLMVSCTEKTGWEPTNYEIINDFNDVSMAVNDQTITPTGLTVVFKNNSKSQAIYGDFFSIEKKIDDHWYQLPTVVEGDYGFNDIGYELYPKESGEQQIDWAWLYGELAQGDYRLIKDILDFRAPGDFDTYYLAVEFSVK